MATEEEIIKKINAKVGILELKKVEVDKTLDKNKTKETKKLITLLDNKLEELRQLKEEAQEQMLINEKSAEDVNTWGQELEGKLETFEEMKETLEVALEKQKIAEDQKEKEKLRYLFSL